MRKEVIAQASTIEEAQAAALAELGLSADRAAEVVMTAGASVREALVEGKLAADVRAAGVIRVGREGVLRGRCDAADIAVEPGGQYIPPRD